MTILKYLAEKDLDLTATLDGEAAYKDADFVVVLPPIHPQKNFFDTCHVEEVIDLVLKVILCRVVIKSTIRGLTQISTCSMPPKA